MKKKRDIIEDIKLKFKDKTDVELLKRLNRERDLEIELNNKKRAFITIPKSTKINGIFLEEKMENIEIKEDLPEPEILETIKRPSIMSPMINLKDMILNDDIKQIRYGKELELKMIEDVNNQLVLKIDKSEAIINEMELILRRGNYLFTKYSPEWFYKFDEYDLDLMKDENYCLYETIKSTVIDKYVYIFNRFSELSIEIDSKNVESEYKYLDKITVTPISTTLKFINGTTILINLLNISNNYSEIGKIFDKVDTILTVSKYNLNIKLGFNFDLDLEGVENVIDLVKIENWSSNYLRYYKMYLNGYKYNEFENGYRAIIQIIRYLKLHKTKGDTYNSYLYLTEDKEEARKIKNDILNKNDPLEELYQLYINNLKKILFIDQDGRRIEFFK
jgi:hypothetical protein